MNKIQTASDLKNIRETIIKNTRKGKTIVTLCGGTGCHASGCSNVISAFKRELKKNKLQDTIDIKVTGCHGFCEKGPIVVLHPKGIFYKQVKPKDVKEIVEQTLLKGKIVDRLLYIDPLTGKKITLEKDVQFYKGQKRIVFADNGLLDPYKIEDYIAIGGYTAAVKALTNMSPEKIIDEIKKSGLRGRGGAGFPTGVKWESCRNAKGTTKYIICNADEGDPGAYMDRSLIEGNPFSILEGMLIGAFSIGASQGIVYVRDEYPIAVQTMKNAIILARQWGLLGKNILNSGFNFDLSIVRGAGAFVCGEETALIASVEGKKGEPRQRPPFPTQKGLWGKPTNINNVETWANIPYIINKGSKWYASIGTEKSKGTKIFSLVGKINNTGLVEVPMGITLKEMIYSIGGGIPDGKAFKGVQTGGPSGGCIPKELLETPIDYEKLKEAGSIMGSGGMVVMDEDTCMVDVARYFLEFLQDESCGKCLSCREGTKRMAEIVTDITKGQGKEGDIELLQELATTVKDTSMCGLGQTAANPVLSTIKFFRDEYETHILERKCPAGVCRDLYISPCQNACPAGMNAPGYISLISEGRFTEALELALDTNPFPSVCGRICDHQCMFKCRRNQIDEPVAIRALKRFIGDYVENGIDYPKMKQPSITVPFKVAIVGAGPAGLSCAYFLARLGYKPTVFEKLPVAGGMMAVAIPEYRLPKAILQREIDNIKKLGVDIRLNTQVGKDITISQLWSQGYQAFFVAVGMYGDRNLGIPGENLENVIQAVDLLSDINLDKPVVSPAGKKVVVIGGGNSAVDAARTMLRMGASTVTIIYRRTRREMPAYVEEIEAAEHEGVQIRFLTAPEKIFGEKGKVKSIECIKMRPGEFDTEGRQKPVPVKASNFFIDADIVIPAIGEFSDVSGLFTGLDVETNRDGTIKTDKHGRTSIPGLFSGGDVVSGPATVINAIASGERTAVTIDQYLTKDRTRKYPWREHKKVDTFFDPEAEPVSYRMQKPRTLQPEERRGCFDEVELSFTKALAMKEAKRCLRCDLELELQEKLQKEKPLEVKR
ncbi:MAG: NADH-quinone oxidoreductase subunit NuoF [Candidatus Thermoplasmatota archaeon]|nr:NADH-quinone oxidoreductase subunit NuoF [Candidatus Thermoplasmatota archaeon]